MKTLLFFLLFIPILSVGQFTISDSTKVKLWTNKTTFSFANIKPANKFTFCGGANKSFSIEFSGDSIICSGDLKPDESAKFFIDYCRKYFKTKIDSLEYELASLKESLEGCEIKADQNREAYLFEKSRFETLSKAIEKVTNTLR